VAEGAAEGSTARRARVISEAVEGADFFFSCASPVFTFASLAFTFASFGFAVCAAVVLGATLA
jgi:hypothetical protein